MMRKALASFRVRLSGSGAGSVAAFAAIWP
jgi:hypothetical protein